VTCDCGGAVFEGNAVRWCVGDGAPVRWRAGSDYKRGCGAVWMLTWRGAWRALKGGAV